MIRTIQSLLILSTVGCGLFGGRGSSTSTSVNFAARTQDIATVKRSEYTLLSNAEGKASEVQWFVLWFPVGTHKSHAQIHDDAFYKAADNVEGCDSILFARTRMRTVFVPTLFVNVLSRQLTLKGRCIRLLDNDELAGAPKIVAPAAPVALVAPVVPVQPVAPAVPTPQPQ
jgi:hypothetical protein